MEVWNVKKAELRKKGFRDLEHWLENPTHVYIGRDMSRYVPGAVGSKWGNPFTLKCGQERAVRVESFRQHVIFSPELMSALPELVGKKLGCWCHPEQCHGDVLMELVREYASKRTGCAVPSAPTTTDVGVASGSTVNTDGVRPGPITARTTTVLSRLCDLPASAKEPAELTSGEPQTPAKVVRRKKRGVLQHSWAKSQGEKDAA